jgi:hypothetical protein
LRLCNGEQYWTGATGAPTQTRKWGIIMASAASKPKKFFAQGDNPPRNSKTNNAGIKVGDRSPIPPVSAPNVEHAP